MKIDTLKKNVQYYGDVSMPAGPAQTKCIYRMVEQFQANNRRAAQKPGAPYPAMRSNRESAYLLMGKK